MIKTAGKWITYTGEIICMRDSAHQKLHLLLKNRQKIPFKLKNKLVLYAAPTEGEKIVIGPTTSIRMDGFLEMILKLGAKGTIGKGKRSSKARALIKKYKAPYYVMLSGVSAYMSKYFTSTEILAFPELGPEAVRRYEVKDLPLLVAIDGKGRSIF